MPVEEDAAGGRIVQVDQIGYFDDETAELQRDGPAGRGRAADEPDAEADKLAELRVGHRAAQADELREDVGFGKGGHAAQRGEGAGDQRRAAAADRVEQDQAGRVDDRDLGKPWQQGEGDGHRGQRMGMLGLIVEGRLGQIHGIGCLHEKGRARRRVQTVEAEARPPHDDLRVDLAVVAEQEVARVRRRRPRRGGRARRWRGAWHRGVRGRRTRAATPRECHQIFPTPAPAGTVAGMDAGLSTVYW